MAEKEIRGACGILVGTYLLLEQQAFEEGEGLDEMAISYSLKSKNKEYKVTVREVKGEQEEDE
jgi:hypothetical protein